MGDPSSHVEQAAAAARAEAAALRVALAAATDPTQEKS